MKRVAVFLIGAVAAVAQAQTAVYREGSTYTDRPSPGATRVTIVLNIVDSYPVPVVPARPLLVAGPTVAAPAPVPQTVINITIRQPSPYNYSHQPRYHHHPRRYR